MFFKVLRLFAGLCAFLGTVFYLTPLVFFGHIPGSMILAGLVLIFGCFTSYYIVKGLLF